MWKWVWPVIAMTLACQGCSEAVAEQGRGQREPSVIQRIVSPDILGSNSAYVESLLGTPPRHTAVDGVGITRNTYEVGECFITTGVRGGRVVSVGLGLTPGVCDVDVAELLGRSQPTLASATTYRDWSVRGPLHFTDLQMPSCMACWESYPFALIDGTSARGMFDILLNGLGDWEGANAWSEAVRQSGLDLDNLPYSGSGCPLRAFDQIGFEQMANTRVDTIEFGRPDAVQPACSARPAQMRRGEDTYLLGD